MSARPTVRIDGTSKESFKRSLAAMTIQLRHEDRARLQLALAILQMGISALASGESDSDDFDAMEAQGRMCVHGLSFEEIIARQDALSSPQERALARIQRIAAASPGSLTAPERVWLAINPLLISIRNGGLISYYDNPYADDLEECMHALHVLNAEEMLDLVRQVNSWFGERVPATVEARNAAMASWGNFDDSLVSEREQAAADRLEQALSAYIDENGLAPR